MGSGCAVWPTAANFVPSVEEVKKQPITLWRAGLGKCHPRIRGGENITVIVLHPRHFCSIRRGGNAAKADIPGGFRPTRSRIGGHVTDQVGYPPAATNFVLVGRRGHRNPVDIRGRAGARRRLRVRAPPVGGQRKQHGHKKSRSFHGFYRLVFCSTAESRVILSQTGFLQAFLDAFLDALLRTTLTRHAG